jgi:hypothetical protein
MRRVDLESSVLNGARYGEECADLDLEYCSGSNYRYIGVAAEVYQGLLMAKSKGQYFQTHV